MWQLFIIVAPRQTEAAAKRISERERESQIQVEVAVSGSLSCPAAWKCNLSGISFFLNFFNKFPRGAASSIARKKAKKLTEVLEIAQKIRIIF